MEFWEVAGVILACTCENSREKGKQEKGVESEGADLIQYSKQRGFPKKRDKHDLSGAPAGGQLEGHGPDGYRLA